MFTEKKAMLQDVANSCSDPLADFCLIFILMQGQDFHKELNFAIRLAREAGGVSDCRLIYCIGIISEAFNSRQLAKVPIEFKVGPDQFDYTIKLNEADLVTKTDKLVEAKIFSALRLEFPDDHFIGEESVSSGNASVCKDVLGRIWIVDPIDGTTNFVHGLPFVCVSIALFLNDEPVLGVVFNPVYSFQPVSFLK